MLAANTAVVHRVSIHCPGRRRMHGRGLRIVGHSRTCHGELQPDSQLKGQQREQNADKRLSTHESKRTQFPDECRNDTEMRRVRNERTLGIGTTFETARNVSANEALLQTAALARPATAANSASVAPPTASKRP